jgi:CheY-like chemotaxis protein
MAKKILIVEDDSFLRELIVKKLLNEGFEVVAAVDGEDGVAKATSEPNIDIMLLDLILPGIDGFEVLTKIKQNPQTNYIPVVILSNLGQKEDIEKGLKLGAKDFLIKAHFVPGEIVSKVKEIIK